MKARKGPVLRAGLKERETRLYSFKPVAFGVSLETYKSRPKEGDAQEHHLWTSLDSPSLYPHRHPAHSSACSSSLVMSNLQVHPVSLAREKLKERVWGFFDSP